MAEGDLLKDMTGEQLEAIRKSAEEFTGHRIYNKKIDKIGLYTRCHSYKWVTIEIGKYLDKQITGPSDEEVAAIFKTEGAYYVVCTPNHGVSQGEPFIFREQEIYKIVEEV